MSTVLSDLIKQMPVNYYVCQKVLWVGDLRVEIDHIDNKLDNPLDYKEAFKKMLEKLDIS